MWLVEFSGFRFYKQSRAVCLQTAILGSGIWRRRLLIEKRFNQWNRFDCCFVFVVVLFACVFRVLSLQSFSSQRSCQVQTHFPKVIKSKLFLSGKTWRFSYFRSEILEVDGSQTVFPRRRHWKVFKMSSAEHREGKHHENVSPTHNCDF